MESGRIGVRTGFGVRELRSTPDGRIEVRALSREGVERTITVDRVVGVAGFRPDHTIADELRLDLDPAPGCTRALA